MAFVKLDCGILDSTLWLDREAREVFITALLMAQPTEFKAEQAQIKVRTIDLTGWLVPPEWYGFVPAAGIGIVHRAKVDPELGLAALERLGEPDPESRSDKHEGRRLIRVTGGYIVLNYMDYRDRDYNGAERARKYRERVKARSENANPSKITSRRYVTPVTPTVTEKHDASRDEHPDVTHAECRVQSAYKDPELEPRTKRVPVRQKARSAMKPEQEPSDQDIAHAHSHGPTDADWPATWAHFRDHHLAKGTLAADWSATWRTWVAGIATRGFQYARKSLEPAAAPAARPEPVKISHLEHRRIKAGESLASVLASRAQGQDGPGDLFPGMVGSA